MKLGDTTRCSQSRLKANKSSAKGRTIATVCTYSKQVFNSGIFFQRRWYDAQRIMYQDCLDNLEDYVSYLSTSDLDRLFKYCVESDNVHGIKKLYSLYPKLVPKNSKYSHVIKITNVSRDLKPHRGRCQNASEILHSVLRLQSLVSFCAVH